MHFVGQVILFIFVCFYSSLHADQPEPTITLEQLIEATPEIKSYTPQLAAHTKLAGKKFTIGAQTYEWHYFAFADPSKNLPSKINFADYVSNHSLHSMKSLSFQPVDGVIFDCFDASRAQTDDMVYFNIVLRRVEDGQ